MLYLSEAIFLLTHTRKEFTKKGKDFGEIPAPCQLPAGAGSTCRNDDGILGFEIEPPNFSLFKIFVCPINSDKKKTNNTKVK